MYSWSRLFQTTNHQHKKLRSICREWIDQVNSYKSCKTTRLFVPITSNYSYSRYGIYVRARTGYLWWPFDTELGENDRTIPFTSSNSIILSLTGERDKKLECELSQVAIERRLVCSILSNIIDFTNTTINICFQLARYKWHKFELRRTQIPTCNCTICPTTWPKRFGCNIRFVSCCNWYQIISQAV